MYYSGIDLHKDNCFITTINDDGELVQQERVPNVPDAVGKPHAVPEYYLE